MLLGFICRAFVVWFLAAFRIFSVIFGFHHYEHDDSRPVCGLIFSFLLGIYLEMELLDHMVIIRLTFWGSTSSFSKQLNHF